MNQLITLLLILTLTCFVFAVLGLAADGYRAIRCWWKADKWTRANEGWKRWTTYRN